MSKTTTLAVPTLTPSYTRPMVDYTDEVLHVVSFIPADTDENAVEDWSPIWNAALDEARAVVAQGRTFELVGPDREQVFFGQVDGTGLVSFGSVIDFRSAVLVCATTGEVTFDFLGAWFMTFRGLRLQGGIGGSGANTDNVPLVGFSWGRAIPDSNADTNSFEGVWANGSFGLAAFYCRAAESNSMDHGWISNNVDPAQMAGVVTSCGTPVPGVANIAYALICDALGHWPVPTLHGQADWPQETAGEACYVSFEQFTTRGVTFTCGAGPALWLSSGTNHDFDDGYLNCGSPDALIDWYRRDNDAPQNFRLRLHCEAANGAGYKSLIRFLGDLDRGACFCDGLEFTDGGTVFGVNFASQAMTNTPDAVLCFTNLKLLIGRATTGTGGAPGGGLWSNPRLFRTHGVISVPIAIWNGNDDAGDGYGHSGDLNLYNPDGTVTAAIVGEVQVRSALALRSVNAALNGLGVSISTDSVCGVTMSFAGNMYSGTGPDTAYTPTVSFPAPPSGTAATGTCVLQINGMGVAEGAKGMGYPNGTTAGCACVDADGLALPFCVTVVGDGNGGIAGVYGDRPAEPLTQIPSGPYTVVVRGASGGQVYADFGIAAVAVTSGGSGYQDYEGVVAPSFRPEVASAPVAVADMVAAVAFGRAKVMPVPVSALPEASASLEGTFAAVVDATSNTSGAALAGGGRHHVPIYCNGSEWTVR